MVLAVAGVLGACSGGGGAAPSTTHATPTTVDPNAAFCATAAALSSAGDPFDAVDAATSAADAERAFSAGLAAIRPLEAQAPKEIAASAKAYVEGFEAYGDLLAAADYDGSQIDRDRLAAVTEQVGRAKAELEAYAIKHCT